MQIQTEVNSHLIIFKDRSKIFISEAEYNKILQNSCNVEYTKNKDFFFLKGQAYSFHTIAKMLTLEEYYRQYPDNKPPAYSGFTKYLPKEKVDMKKALQDMIKGIKKTITTRERNGETTSNAKMLLKEVWKKYLELLPRATG